MRRNERGSVTLIVLVTILFIVILLSSFLVYVSSRRRAQLKETEEIAASYDGDMAETYNSLKGEFDTSYGKIEVVWIDKENNVITKPLAPVLSGMTPLKWNGVTEVTTTSSDTTWYNYASIEGKEDNITSMWANAKNSDGSYFVWIPRYAYRITYYESEDSNKITGYCDGRGIVNTVGKVEYPLDEGIETVNSNNKSYIIHPAFMKDDVNEYEHGGWSSNLSGIWVSKYEMSMENNGTNVVTTDANGNVLTSTEIKAVSKPNVTSWRFINVDKMYTNSYNYDRAKESHLMKNSEWGAVSYLTHSQYGRNGHEIDMNNSTTFVTGNGGGSTDANPKEGITNAYNTEIGQKASSTGNIYGIYDLSGGAWEYVTAYNDTDVNNYEGQYASSFANVENKSTKYANKYINKTEETIGMKIYEVGKIGDATKEVYKRSELLNWFKDSTYFLNSTNPILARGGRESGKSETGVFCTGRYWGIGNNFSFRIVLAI